MRLKGTLHICQIEIVTHFRFSKFDGLEIVNPDVFLSSKKSLGL